MEFKVDPKEEKGRWDGDKKRRFMELVEDLNQIISAEPARAEVIGVADSVQVNNGDTGQGYPIQPQGEGEPFQPQGERFPLQLQGDPVQGDKWSIDEGIQQSDDSFKNFCSRESESAIYPPLSNEELQALLSKKVEDILRLTAENKDVKERYENLAAEHKDLKAKMLSSIQPLADTT